MTAVKYYTSAPAVRLTSNGWQADLALHLRSMGISRTTNEVSELTISVDDPDYALLRSGGDLLNTKVTTLGLNYIVDSYDWDEGGGEGGWTLNCRPKIVRDLKNRRGPYVLNNVTPTTWVSREVKAVGAKFVGQVSATRKRVARDVPGKDKKDTGDEKPSSWTTIKRLAEELGFIVFEDAGTVYFGKPTWLINNVANSQIKWDEGDPSKRMTTLPKFHASMDEPDKGEFTITLPVEQAEFLRPGMRVHLSNFPTRAGAYLLTSIDHPIYASAADVSLTLQKPVDPTAQPPDPPKPVAKKK
jgi:hypothetical protein